MNKLLFAGLTVTLCAIAPQASAQMGNIYLAPQCDLNTRHFLVKNAAAYVKSATETQSEEDRAEHLADAERVLIDALGRGEEGNPAVWYFLGRYYVMVPDYVGADSAFAKAETMEPECVEDIDTHRRFAWSSVYGLAVEDIQANDYESARTHLEQANIIWHHEPFVPYYLASIYLNDGNNEEALKYFKDMVLMRVDTGDYQEPYGISLFNVARIHHMLGELDSAGVWYEEYRLVDPEDPQGLTGLASIYDATGREVEALAMFDEILDRAASMSVTELFSVGVNLFEAAQYERAARAFALGVERNPYHRDGVYNLAQAYYAIASPDEPDVEEPPAEVLEARREAAASMLEAAIQLAEWDTQNSSTLRLLAAAYQLQKNDDSTLAVITRMNELRYDISVDVFQSTGSGLMVHGTVANLTEADEVTVPAFEFDFVDADGQVLVTETFDGATLAPQASAEFNFRPTGEGLVGWRYRLSSPETDQ